MLKTVLRVTALSALITLTVTGVAWAHTEVSPSEASPGSTETFTVSAPGEKSVPIVKERVEVPKGFEVTDVSSPSGWKGGIQGESLVWTGGEIAEDRVQEFTFTARTPDEPGEYAWRTFDTYKDGSVSKWIGPPDSEHPASVTRIGSGGSSGSGEMEGHEPSEGHHGAGMESGENIPDTGGMDPALLVSLTGFFTLALGLTGLAVLRRS